MASPDEIAEARQGSLIAISSKATSRGLREWRKMDFAALDASWESIVPSLVATATSAQMASARGADRFTSAISSEYGFAAQRAAIVPEAFAGVDGSGRDVGSLLHGAVTTTKQAVGLGLGATQSMEAGATYLAAMMKTLVADLARSSDMVSSTGKGYLRYVRVVEPGACSRCIVLAGSDRFRPFKRHPACKCTTQPIPDEEWATSTRYSPDGVFHSMSEADQDRAFGKAGARAIRDGADVGQVQSARRGANFMSSANRMPSSAEWSRMQKTTIGYRPNGDPVRVYSTSEGTTARGDFGRSQRRTSEVQRLSGARYTSTKRVRLMPESIYEIAGDDEVLAQAFLRDAGYLQYRPPNGYDRGNKWLAEVQEMRIADRKTVNKATIQFGNFTLG